jgi:L-rhamnose isomerase
MSTAELISGGYQSVPVKETDPYNELEIQSIDPELVDLLSKEVDHLHAVHWNGQHVLEQVWAATDTIMSVMQDIDDLNRNHAPLIKAFLKEAKMGRSESQNIATSNQSGTHSFISIIPFPFARNTLS